jgi:hypothetical protein
MQQPRFYILLHDYFISHQLLTRYYNNNFYACCHRIIEKVFGKIIFNEAGILEIVCF